MEIEKTEKQASVPRGMGNQVSCEFSLLYRFHSAISKDDADWTEHFFKECLPANLQHKSLEELTVEDMHSMMNIFAKRAAPEEETVDYAKQASPQTKNGDSGAQKTGPEFREFGGLKRGLDGRFDDAELAAILKHKIDDPAGVFGAKHVPKALRVVEMAGIVAARKWEVASVSVLFIDDGFGQFPSPVFPLAFFNTPVSGTDVMVLSTLLLCCFAKAFHGVTTSLMPLL